MTWLLVHPYLTEFRGIPIANIENHQVGYDADTNRIVFPNYWRGELIGWQTRRIVNDGSPKYENSYQFAQEGNPLQRRHSL